MSNETNASAKAIRLVVVAYLVTMVVTVLAVAIAFMILVEPRSCSAMTRALLVLWTTLAALFLASVMVVGVAAWKVIPRVAGRLAAVGVYGVALLGSYVVIAFGLLVAFNC